MQEEPGFFGLGFWQRLGVGWSPLSREDASHERCVANPYKPDSAFLHHSSCLDDRISMSYEPMNLNHEPKP